MKDSMNSCKYFRDEYNHHLKVNSKKLDKQYESSSGYHVCIKTMTVSGPDHQPVSLNECQAGRQCFIK